MGSRGKKKKTEDISFAETMFRAMARTTLLMQRASDHERKRLGIESPKEKQKLLIIKNDGAILFNGEAIQFKNPGTYPHKVLVAILKTHDVALGYAPYKKINRWIEALGVSKLESDEKITRRIRNAIDNIFRSSNLPKATPDGEPLIDIVDGKGVVLRNPTIE